MTCQAFELIVTFSEIPAGLVRPMHVWFWNRGVKCKRLLHHIRAKLMYWCSFRTDNPRDSSSHFAFWVPFLRPDSSLCPSKVYYRIPSRSRCGFLTIKLSILRAVHAFGLFWLRLNVINPGCVIKFLNVLCQRKGGGGL